MVSRDLNFIVAQLEKRIDKLERLNNNLSGEKSLQDSDWDDATLRDQWNVCKRTAANYRKKGLGYYKRGGRIFYTPKNRSDFKNKQH